MLTGRLLPQEIRFQSIQYKQRQKLDQYRADIMKEFLQLESCRSQFLLAYFGEKEAAECGVCDICESNRQSKKSKLIVASVVNRLKGHDMSFDQVMEGLPQYGKDEAWRAVRWQIEEGNIEWDEYHSKLRLPKR